MDPNDPPFYVVAGATFTAQRIVVSTKYFVALRAYALAPSLIKDERDIKVVQHIDGKYKSAIFDYFPGLPSFVIANFTGEHCAGVAEAVRLTNKGCALPDIKPGAAEIWDEGCKILHRAYDDDPAFQTLVKERLDRQKMTRLKANDAYLSIATGLDLGTFDPSTRNNPAMWCLNN